MKTIHGFDRTYGMFFIAGGGNRWVSRETEPKRRTCPRCGRRRITVGGRCLECENNLDAGAATAINRAFFL